MPSGNSSGGEDSSALIIVTGGLSGIGAATAQMLAARSGQVIVLDRATTAAAANDVILYPEPVDVSDEIAVANACSAIEDRRGPITGLVNAAGILGKMHPPHRLALADWDREIAVDLRGTFVTCREVGTRMCRRKSGAIVNVASVAGMLSAPVHGYAPAKAGVISLTATLAAEWGRCGVRVNCVSPGFTSTPALTKGLAKGALNEDSLKRVSALGRLVTAQEVAATIVWLLSNDASGITGANIPVDAGFIAGVPWQAYGGFRGAESV
jgi:NAD(P)-dependent dehydrogenase (short-subunit alcohol dehydrogenase family)